LTTSVEPILFPGRRVTFARSCPEPGGVGVCIGVAFIFKWRWLLDRSVLNLGRVGNDHWDHRLRRNKRLRVHRGCRGRCRGRCRRNERLRRGHVGAHVSSPISASFAALSVVALRVNTLNVESITTEASSAAEPTCVIAGSVTALGIISLYIVALDVVSRAAVEAPHIVVVSVAALAVVAELVIISTVEVADHSGLSGRVATFVTARSPVRDRVDASSQVAGTGVEPPEAICEFLPSFVLLIVVLELSILGQSLSFLLILPVSVVVVPQLLVVETCAWLLLVGVEPTTVAP